jgi:TnpA family transposase
MFPPTLGYGQGLTFYRWTSDQLSQYGSKPVIITARDATYVLDAILGNATELAILEHTTDTAGATEISFALFDLLGLRFTPRLRDIGSRRLYRSGAIDLHHYPRLQPHITGRINRQRVLDWWDDMLRAAGSMKLGHVTASLLVQKLQAYPQQNALAQALQEYGRVVRTIHVLRWYANNDDRRRVMRQLNKGEALHDLRAYLMIANKGQLRRNRGDELVNQASCLNLVTNAVILWNTVYMAEAVAQLKREGYPVNESDLAHIWPTRYAHINVYGRYYFNIEEAQKREGLRPLRRTGSPIPSLSKFLYYYRKACSPWRFASSSCPYCSFVTPSTPTAASARCRRYARSRAGTSIRCVSAWNRPSGSRCARSTPFTSPGDMSSNVEALAMVPS